jgi:ATP/maltotriose-dependent transcriptional regulator MalT
VSVTEPQAGWAALAAGRWEDARGSFTAALEAEETAEGWEGLSWAAWWLDDAPSVFEAREHAYRLYRARGDEADAARMATWLAVDELDFHGAAAVAGGWLRRAHRHLDPLEPGPAHGWLAFQEGFVAHASGDTERACVLAASAAELGRRHGVPDLEMLGLALDGAALVACAEVEQGMQRLDEATTIALAGEATVPISSAWACCFLVSACMSVLDLERAVAWCDRIAEFAERYGSRYMLAFCRADYGTVDMRRGRWDDAEAMLEAAVEDYSRSRPAWVGGPLVALAELRRRQGRLADAAVLLEETGPSRSAELCRARIALGVGDASHAIEILDRLLRRIDERRRLDRAPALELLVHAHAARGGLEEAAVALTAFREAERAAGTPLLRAAADLADGVLAASAGEHERARLLLEDAVDRYEKCGEPYEAARARLALATSLAAGGIPEAARREATAARTRFLELGAALDADGARRLLEEIEGPGTAVAELTRREREILGLVAEGLTNRQIAARLVISEHTVHRHVTNVLRKLGVPSRTAAAAIAAREGISQRA